MSLLSDKTAVHVDVRLKRCTEHLQKLRTSIQPQLNAYIESASPLPLNVNLKVPDTDPILARIDSIFLEQETRSRHPTTSQHYCFHFYMMQPPEMSGCLLESCGGDSGGDNSDVVTPANHWLLPCDEFQGIWQNLIYEDGLKEKLLKFALSALTFSQHNVDPNVIACNRLILLHGPPGTGKTSLCKALAQKLAIRTLNTYAYTHLVEINSHSLFSKWFSESGKLVARLFAKIGELVADKNNLVCVLIDEVESLAYARNSMSSNEPRDAMRVVNALLTQLDGIKTKPNVLIMATSNLAESIDLAFLDRADIRQYVGMPTVPAIRFIYKSMLSELMTVGVLKRESVEQEDAQEGLLTTLAERSIGLSGRTLRKLPLLAHVQHMSSDVFEVNGKIHLSDFLDALMIALDQHQHEQCHLKQEAPL